MTTTCTTRGSPRCLFAGVVSSVALLGCSTGASTVDPTKLYGLWASAWPLPDAAQSAGVACGAAAPPLNAFCERHEMAISPVPPEATNVAPQLGGFAATVDVVSFGCDFPWSAGASSDVLHFPVGARPIDWWWPKAPKGTFHVGEFFADDENLRVLNCALKTEDALVCRELEGLGSWGTSPYVYREAEFHFRRVDALSQPMLCDQVVEQGLLLGGLRLPQLGDW
ncbi:MAG: hypothetical protein JNM72_26255 [Deltaproteobacteria bacterium]|nr:hypothetical protein [Deltaproteobacteria bacterium]